MWGNDPDFTPQDALAGKKPQESWINKNADDLRVALKGTKGTRPSWGWWGRMNGPGKHKSCVDYFLY
jgi:hypothetical protein